MSDFSLDLIGDEELLAALRELDYKTQHKQLKKVVSDAANVLIKPTRAAIPIRRTNLTPYNTAHTTESGVAKTSRGYVNKWHKPGTGRRSITKKAGRSKRNAVYFVGPRTNTNNYDTDGFYLKYWEFGTKRMTGRHGIVSAYRANLSRVEANMATSLRRVWERAMKRAK